MSLHLTASGLAEHFGVSLSTLNRWRDKGDLPPPEHTPRGVEVWDPTYVETHMGLPPLVPDSFLTTAQVAERYGVTAQWVRKKSKEGGFPRHAARSKGVLYWDPVALDRHDKVTAVPSHYLDTVGVMRRYGFAHATAVSAAVREGGLPPATVKMGRRNYWDPAALDRQDATRLRSVSEVAELYGINAADIDAAINAGTVPPHDCTRRGRRYWRATSLALHDSDRLLWEYNYSRAGDHLGDYLTDTDLMRLYDINIADLLLRLHTGDIPPPALEDRGTRYWDPASLSAEDQYKIQLQRLTDKPD